MGLVKFYYGAKLPASPNSDTLYFLNSGELYKGATLIADVTDTIAIQSMIDDAIGGIGKAARFIGHSSTPLTDGGNEIPTIDGEPFTHIEAGDVVFYDNKEFICTITGKWELFGDEGNYATIAAFDELAESVGKIVSGDVKVESAKLADDATQALVANEAHYAITAGSANTADTATTAGSAATANFAEKAQSAELATKAESATEAEHAATATQADKASEADHASTADLSEKANSLALSDSIGTNNRPVYFNSNGLPTPIDYSIDISVPSDALFTDTISTIKSTTGSGNAITGIAVDNLGQFTIAKDSTFALESSLQSLITALTWTTV